MERNILRNHCLWQKSWTGPPQTTLSRSLTPRSSTISNSYSTISKPSKQGGRESNDSVLRRWKSVPSELGQFLSDEREPISMAEMLDNRRQERRYRRKPWTEKVTIKHNNPKYNREFLYGSFLPSDLTDVKRRTRKYVTNSKYGDIYELRYEVDKETKTEKQPFSRWLWEKEYKVWLSEKSPPRSRSEHSSRLEMTSPVRSKTPSSSRSQEPGGGAISLNRSITPSSNSRFAKKGAPDPQFYASYHSHRLQQRRRNDAARLIQAVFRGWSVRRFLQKLKRKVRLEHLMSWENFVNDYKNLIKRVQERYDVKRPYCGVDLKELLAFLDSKLKYEQTFRKLAYGDRVLKEDLPEFFTACDLHPTEGEIQQAFEKVFKGGNNSGEVIFVLDCSTSVTPMCFHYLTQFVKSVVESFTIGPDNIRVGVIPYSDDVYQAFGINRYNMTYQICSAVDNIAHNEGLTRTDLALKEMKKMFMCARPGVQKTGIVITDGKSSCPERTSQAARHVKEDNVNVITIGVGSQVDMEELRHIASSAKNVYSVYDYSSIHRLKDVIARRTCLAACVLCQTILPRIRDSGLYLREVLEIAWTLYIPIGCEISWYTETESDDSKQFSHKFGESCRPLERREVMEILWTTYPPSATKLNIRSSRWVRPMSKGTEAWTLLDEKVKKSTDINTCLQLVIKTKIEREGFITLPSDVREGVEQVSDPDIALDMVNKWIAQKQKEGSKFKGLN